MTPHQLKTLRNIAKRYREEQNLPAGFVTLVGSFFGHCKPELDGWVLRLDRPSAFIPGCFAVSSSGEVFVAEGGNDYNGAQAWVPLSPLPGQESPGARLAASAEADQVEGTGLPVDVPESETLWSYLSNGYSLTHVRSCLASGIPSVEQEARVICDRVQKAWAEIRTEVSTKPARGAVGTESAARPNGAPGRTLC